METGASGRAGEAIGAVRKSERRSRHSNSESRRGVWSDGENQALPLGLSTTFRSSQSTVSRLSTISALYSEMVLVARRDHGKPEAHFPPLRSLARDDTTPWQSQSDCV